MQNKHRRGFTLLELLVVLVIMGGLLGLATTNMDSITPSSRIGATAREISSTISLGLDRAVLLGKKVKIRYEIDKRYYLLLLPSKDGVYEPLSPNYLPRGVQIKDIEVPGDKTYTRGFIEIEMLTLGTTTGHAIHLINEEKMELTVEINPLSGLVTTKKGYQDVGFLEQP